MLRFTADNEKAGNRLDKILAELITEYPRSALLKIFTHNLITVNGKNTKPGYKLKLKDSVEVDDTVLIAKQHNIKLPIIYEDADVIVIDKPAGVLTHSKGAFNDESTVADFIKPRLTDAKMQGNRAGIVHRLDRATSGLIICAKHARALAMIQKQFSSRNIKKKYLAIVEGVPSQPEAMIDIPIMRSPANPKKFITSLRGKSAQTVYKLKKVIKYKNKEYGLLELTPVTGRTHQLRLHMNYIGHPIVGDELYGSGGKHMMLHAAELELTVPSGARKSFKCEVPVYFKDMANG